MVIICYGKEAKDVELSLPNQNEEILKLGSQIT
jgi:hypothetical protein